jgi:CheY-like chemotaxis protein
MLQPTSILIVDDNPDTAALADCLRADGYRVRVALTARDSLARLAGWTPDAAVIDLETSDRGGLRVAAALSRRPQGRPLLIGLLRPGQACGSTHDELAVFDHVFLKSVSPMVLAETIGHFTAHKTPHVPVSGPRACGGRPRR